jgi:dTDP-4-amino-4,6-dideoxygalactose transaminase
MYSDINEIIPILESMGHTVDDPWDIVSAFESLIADYSGSKYAVSVDSCTNALFLCLKYLNAKGEVTIPGRTYISVPQAIIHAGCDVSFSDDEWTGTYMLSPFPIVDGATRFTKGMYEAGTYHCLSFHIKKTLGIGKGGMVLTDDKSAVDWLKKARYEGRDITKAYDEDSISTLGWNMYMPPEQAAYGISKFLQLKEKNEDCGSSQKYEDVRKHPLFR